MGNFLHTLGNYGFTHPWRVIISWLVILGILGFTAFQFIQPTSSSISIPGTEAQKAITRVGEIFPEAGGGTGRIVFQAGDGKTIADQAAAITALTDKVATIDGVAQVASPFIDPSFISESGTIAYAQVQLSETQGSVELSTLEAVEKAVDDARTNGLQIEIGGDLINSAPGEILGIGEIAGVMIALLVLVMTLGSLVAAGLPLITAILSIGISMAGLFSLSQVFEISATTPVLAVMLGLAVGIDYSLFIINKYRFYVLKGLSYKEAAGRAIATAGNAVIFAALTVVIALSALTVVQIPFMTTMGLVGAASIAIAAIVAVTLIPALLGVIGHRVFSKKKRAAIEKAQAKKTKKTSDIDRSTIWYRWGKAITAKPILVLTIAVAAIVILALPAKDLTLGLPTDQYAQQDSTQRKAYDLLSDGFGAGFNGPLTVVVEGLPAVTDAEKAFAGPYANLIQLKKVADEIATLDGVAQTLPAKATEDGTKGIIQVIPTSAPADKETKDLITNLRNVDTQKELTGGSDISFAVTGSTALQEDINEKLANALPVYLLVVVGLSLVLLIVAFRSILVPIKATLGFLLSVVAMFGVLVAVFQWGWLGIADAPGPIVSFIPIIAIGILFGLAMDYEFFLVSGMHESYTRSKDAKKAVVDGFGMGSKVVTAAGVIMVSVFAGFILNHDLTIQAIGFGLAVGILVDAFIVRMTIVPAVMTLLGKHAWWIPKWLDKRLPHISIEGETDKD